MWRMRCGCIGEEQTGSVPPLQRSESGRERYAVIGPGSTHHGPLPCGSRALDGTGFRKYLAVDPPTK